MKEIIWENIAKKVSKIEKLQDGYVESSGNLVAQKALEQILGKKNVVVAVDKYIYGGIGSETARSVLALLKSEEAMKRCHDYYKNDPDLKMRQRAIELLRVISNHTIVKWIPQYLKDPDPDIQYWSADILTYHLILENEDVEDYKNILKIMKKHKNLKVRNIFTVISRYYQEKGYDHNFTNKYK